MKAIGEVTSSSIKSFVAEVWRQGNPDNNESLPKFGSFLRCQSTVDELEVFGIVYDIISGPQDGHHKATALRMTREELRQEQPQIFSLLKTELHAVICGYRQNGQFFASLAPQPPQVHDFVWTMSAEEIKLASSDLEFLRLISWVSSVPGDELMAAAIKEASKARNNDYQFLVETGQNLSKIFRDDYDRLLALLKKINPKND
ncbi:MAG: hypothetical protein K2W82_06315 [Candidatus Obscuribacterales bacterium]|nr:hypothetical protein [Candidatus Obscuribacterales bacterium]